MPINHGIVNGKWRLGHQNFKSNYYVSSTQYRKYPNKPPSVARLLADGLQASLQKKGLLEYLQYSIYYFALTIGSVQYHRLDGMKREIGW